MAEAAHEYEQALRPTEDADYSEAERATLGAAATLLYERKACGQAAGLRKLLVASSESVGYGDWFQLALSARCAQHWDDAVKASFLALEQAVEPAERTTA